MINSGLLWVRLKVQKWLYLAMKIEPTLSRSRVEIVVSLSGEVLVAAIIFKGQYSRSGWIDDEAPDYYYSGSKSGYTTYWLSWRWLEEVFIPQVKERTNNGKVLLIMNGHGSHKTNKFKKNMGKQ
ncbi:transposase, putative [Candida dubliniensis CD36]|uniref:Transposase, putative n=1 Tax=Candida dubliniensis (strain CD36 / ATCC MYA-646 / CBS 7987 / NCPF 3949 / NRRL Y-17841) TaxID=573826 RepID=B9WKV6_CANDC|nr:transposase, putative [Candida dubliniensis CD36]CAX39656.1 transposase, putative [Candida dubliniensis CD36]